VEIVLVLIAAAIFWWLKDYADQASLRAKRRRGDRVRLAKRAAAGAARRAQREEEQRQAVAHLPIAADQHWSEAQTRAGAAIDALEAAGGASAANRAAGFYEKLFEVTDAARAAHLAIVEARKSLRQYEEGRLARLTYSLPSSKLGDHEFAPLVQGMLGLTNCAHEMFVAADGDPLFAQARTQLEATRHAANHAREILALDAAAANAPLDNGGQPATLADAFDAVTLRLSELAADVAGAASATGTIRYTAETRPASARAAGKASQETQDLVGRIGRAVLNVNTNVMPGLLHRS
jgi:hypothetical protein